MVTEIRFTEFISHLLGRGHGLVLFRGRGHVLDPFPYHVHVP